MTTKGIIFFAFMVIGAILNFFAKNISVKINKSEITIKLTGLVLVITSVTLLMIFGK